jgi:hypothetical protein
VLVISILARRENITATSVLAAVKQRQVPPTVVATAADVLGGLPACTSGKIILELYSQEVI